MGFGLTNASTSFCRLIDKIVVDTTQRYRLLYVNNFFVPQAKLLCACRSLGRVLDRYRDSGLKIQPSNCAFEEASVTFLRRRVSKNGLVPDPENDCCSRFFSAERFTYASGMKHPTWDKGLLHSFICCIICLGTLATLASFVVLIGSHCNTSQPEHRLASRVATYYKLFSSLHGTQNWRHHSVTVNEGSQLQLGKCS